MEVSVLLKKLDSLNEEGNKVQQEIQSVDSELAEAVLQHDVLSQVWEFKRVHSKRIERTKKKLKEMSREDPTTAIALETEAAYGFQWYVFCRKKECVMTSLRDQCEKLKEKKENLLSSLTAEV